MINTRRFTAWINLSASRFKGNLKNKRHEQLKLETLQQRCVLGGNGKDLYE